MRTRVGLHDVGADRGTARIRVLDDHARRLVELAYRAPARVGVQDVVVRELLALELLGPRKRMLGRVQQAIEGRLLMAGSRRSAGLGPSPADSVARVERVFGA